MQTHTVRNKNKPNPIISFTPKFLADVKKAHPEAVSLMLRKLFDDYKNLTGKLPTLDYVQETELAVLFGAKEGQRSWSSSLSQLPALPYKLVKTFEQGFLSAPIQTTSDALELAQEFFTLVKAAYVQNID